MKILVVDVGNTSTTLALAGPRSVTHAHRLAGGRRCSAKEVDRSVRGLVRLGKPGAAVLCSVVPACNAMWKRSLKNAVGTDPLVVTHKLALGIRIDYPEPASIGADRLADACGATYRYGTPVIVADFGTALTFDVVSREGAYVGGVITPGLPFMSDYLAEKTALLPHIHLGGRCQPVGRSTTSAMRIGARIGYRGMVREIVGYLSRTVGGDVKLCATGGYANWALAGLDLPFAFDPHLTLHGLRRIYELNRGGSK